ncbi:MAG: hypothetical protein HQL95_15325 [Magnetococcales bacterium]|nr:hypothetical protein [Magnetococcales bacterium]
MTRELEETRRRAERAEADVAALRQVLRKVPHGGGDHTDFCRMENEGLPPREDSLCHCHVALIRRALAK